MWLLFHNFKIFIFLSFVSFNSKLSVLHGVEAQDFCEETQKCDSSGTVCVTFEQTQAGFSAISIPDSNVYCLDNNYYPPIIKCLEDATWEQTEIICEGTPTPVTTTLTTTLENEITDKDIWDIADSLTQNQLTLFSAYDVYLMSKLSCRVIGLAENPIGFIAMVDEQIIIDSQRVFFSTDIALECLSLQIDNCRSDCEQQNSGQQLSLSTIAPEYRFFEVILNAYISLYDEFDDIEGELSSNPDARMIVSFDDFSRSNNLMAVGFFSNFLFAEAGEKRTIINSDIIGIALPTEDKDKTVSFDVYFKETEQSEETIVCIFWKYGADENSVLVYGQWVIDSDPEVLQNGIYICACTHAGYFALGSTKTTTTTTTTETTTTSNTPSTTTTSTTTDPGESEITCPEDSQCFSSKCFTFPKTLGGIFTTPIPDDTTYCFDSNYYPPRRFCFNNGTWSSFEIICDDAIEPTEVTKILTEKYKDSSVNDKLSTVYSVVNSYQQISSYDVYLMSQLVKLETVENSAVLQTKLDAISNMTIIDKNILRDTQRVFNATDIILDNFNQNLEVLYPNPDVYVTKSIGVFTVAPSDGIFQIFNDLTSDVVSDEIDTALEIFMQNQNSDVLVSITDHTRSNVTCVTVFSNDSFFNGDTITQINSRVVSFLSFEPSPSGAFDVYFKQTNRVNLEQKCVSYKFVFDTNSNTISGKWVIESTSTDIENSVFRCSFNTLPRGYFAISSIQPPPNCPEDVISVDKTQLTFPETEAGSWALPEELCLDADYKSVRRQCREDSTWGAVIGTCDTSNEISETTHSLWDLQNITNSSEALEKLSNITKTDKTKIKAVDVYLISNILEKISANTGDGDGDKFIEVIDDITLFDEQVLKESQRDLNSTDKILFSLDNFLMNTKQSKIKLSKPNLFSSSLEISEDIGGFLVLKSRSVIPLSRDVNFTEVIVSTLNLDFALVLKSHRGSSGYISGFFNSLLFNSENATGDSVFDNVFSILLPGVELEIYFVLDADGATCSYWKYGKNDKNMPISGSWASESQATLVVKGVFKCNYNHTTHFGLLLPNAIPDNSFLSLITIFGTFLSLFAILIIIVSALMFKNFRNESRNKIVLCLALSQMFLIIFVFISDGVGRGGFCVFVGVVLHYLVLTNFFWMLTICYFEYLHSQGTKTSNAEDRKLFAKFSLLSWGFPLLIVIFVLASNAETYNKTRRGRNELCYPKDIYFQMSILLPMSVIMAINLILYGLIIKQSAISLNFLHKLIRRNNTADATNAERRVKTIKKSVFFMFFVIGLTWIFGLVGAFSTDVVVSDVFSYLFCMVVVFQGFVVFVHYVYGTETFRASWRFTVEKVSSTFGSKKPQKRASDTSYVSES